MNKAIVVAAMLLVAAPVLAAPAPRPERDARADRPVVTTERPDRPERADRPAR